MTDKRPPLKILFAGILFFFVGLAVLLQNVYGAGIAHIAVPLLFMLAGVFSLYLCVGKRGTAGYFITGVFLFLFGMFLVFSDIIFDNIQHPVWSVFMFIFGLALVIYSAGKRHKEIHILVPAVAICTMAVVFMPFNFRLFTTSLSKFVVTWWPVLCIFAGALVMVIYFIVFSRRVRRKGF